MPIGNDMDGLIGLRFNELKAFLVSKGKIKADTDEYDTCQAFIEWEAEFDKDHSWKLGYLFGCSDFLDCTLAELIDEVDWKRVKTT